MPQMSGCISPTRMVSMDGAFKVPRMKPSGNNDPSNLEMGKWDLQQLVDLIQENEMMSEQLT